VAILISHSISEPGNQSNRLRVRLTKTASKKHFDPNRKQLQIAIYYKVSTSSDTENVLRTVPMTVPMIGLQEENPYCPRGIIHNLWIILWIFKLISCKTQLFLLLL
jgi:hypothetical protein